MDLIRPIEALIPGVRGQVLAVLVDAGRELSTAQIARLSHTSTAQASRVLAQLAELGIVLRREVPPSVQYELVDTNQVVSLLRQLRALRETVITCAHEAFDLIAPPPAHMSIFGSVATGTAGKGSDIDVLIVRPIKADDRDEWTESVNRWRQEVSECSGNRVELLEVSEEDWRSRDVTEPLWRSIERDEILLSPETAAVRR